MNNTKAQLHISETIAVLFIFFVLVLFGLIFYYRYQESAFNNKQQELAIAHAQDVSLQSLFLPELMCSKSNAEAEDNCLDVHKVASAKDIFNVHRDYYFDLFGYSNVSVHQIYPLVWTWTLYDHSNIAGKGNYKATRFVVALKNETKNMNVPEYTVGYLEVGVYS